MHPASQDPRGIFKPRPNGRFKGTCHLSLRGVVWSGQQLVSAADKIACLPGSARWAWRVLTAPCALLSMQAEDPEAWRSLEQAAAAMARGGDANASEVSIKPPATQCLLLLHAWKLDTLTPACQEE
jgi:hypothetical protein